MFDISAYKLSRLPHLSKTSLKIPNQSNQILDSVLIKNRNKSNTVCLIILHGYRSNKLEIIDLLSSVPSDIDIFSFDFSGSGKSQGKINTFGLKQSKDIDAVINKLKTPQIGGYKKFIIWGRSMGAVASVLHSCSYNNKVGLKDSQYSFKINNSKKNTPTNRLSTLSSSEKSPQDILLQILDSPFSSFQSICHHQAKQKIHLPEMFISIGLDILKNKLSENSHQLNPFNINLSKDSKNCKISSLFVYNQNDDMIPAENSQTIIDSLPKSTVYQKLLINQDHNSHRKPETISKIFTIIKKFHNKHIYNDNKLNNQSKQGQYQQKNKNFLYISKFLQQTETSTPKKQVKERRSVSIADLGILPIKLPTFQNKINSNNLTENKGKIITIQKYSKSGSPLKGLKHFNQTQCQNSNTNLFHNKLPLRHCLSLKGKKNLFCSIHKKDPEHKFQKQKQRTMQQNYRTIKTKRTKIEQQICQEIQNQIPSQNVIKQTL